MGETVNPNPQPIQPNVPPPPVMMESPPNVPKKQDKVDLPLLLVIVIGTFVILGGVGYFAYQKYGKPTPAPTPIVYVPPSTQGTETPDPMANWKEYTSAELGISYKLPEGLIVIEDQDGQEIIKDQERSYCISYKDAAVTTPDKSPRTSGVCTPDVFGIASTSKSYAALSTSSFANINGYELKDGSYYALYAKGLKIKIPQGLVKELSSLSGVSILKVTGDDNTTPKGPVSGTPGKGSLGAIINLTGNDNYPGLNIIFTPTESFDEKTFDLILSTIKTTNVMGLSTSSQPVSTDIPKGWIEHAFDFLKLKIYTPDDWKSSAEYFTEEKTTLVKFWKKDTPDTVPILLDIRPNWDGLEDIKDQKKNYKVDDNIEAVRIDPPKKEEQTLDKYQADIYFEKDGKVYDFQCIHNWVADYLETCNKMLELITFIK